MSFITPDMTAKKILSKYLQKQVLKPRNYSPFTNPTIICLMDVKVYLWHSFEFLSQSLIFFSEDKDSDGKEKKAKSKEKKKEVSTMFQISGDKEAKSKKKG